jgi:hypothetical protein
MLQEIEILVSQSNFSKSELMDTPVYERKLFLNKLIDRRMQEEEEMNKNKRG